MDEKKFTEFFVIFHKLDSGGNGLDKNQIGNTRIMKLQKRWKYYSVTNE